MHLSAGSMQLLRDLPARLPRPHNQHGATRQLLRVAVLVGVELQDAPGKAAARAGTFGTW